jgi:general secretion pathway protein C
MIRSCGGVAIPISRGRPPGVRGALNPRANLAYDRAASMPLARRQQLALELVLLALVAYLAARGVNAAIGLAVDEVPPAPSPAAATGAEPRAPGPLADYAVIAARDVFNPSAGGGAGRQRNLRLWGVGLDGRDARAVIEDTATHRQELYRVGDTIGAGRIVAIDWDRVTIAGAGGEEVLELSPPENPPPAEASTEAAPTPADDRIRRTGENAWVVDRRELAEAGEGMSGLMTQLRAVAEVHDGRPAGFRLFQIRDDSLFARLGLRDGDVVRRVNGAEIGEPAALLGFLTRLRTEPRVALDIVRGDAPRTLVYDLR